jgi:hypothetical protein
MNSSWTAVAASARRPEDDWEQCLNERRCTRGRLSQRARVDQRTIGNSASTSGVDRGAPAQAARHAGAPLSATRRSSRIALGCEICNSLSAAVLLKLSRLPLVCQPIGCGWSRPLRHDARGAVLVGVESTACRRSDHRVVRLFLPGRSRLVSQSRNGRAWVVRGQVITARTRGRGHTERRTSRSAADGANRRSRQARST